MRQGHDNGVFSEDGKVIGINLGADFTSEHEWGIRSLQSLAKMDKKGTGIEARRIHIDENNKEHLHLLKRTVKDKKETCLCFNRFYDDIEQSLESYKEPYWDDNELITYWDERGFLIRMKGDKQAFLSTLHRAILNGDGCIFFGGGNNAFQNSGLCVAKVSMLPQDFVKKLYEADHNADILKATVSATNIENILKEAGKRYFALSPRWKDGKVKGEIIFWLNPMEQDDNNFGWFGLADLLAWAEDKGSIPISK